MVACICQCTLSDLFIALDEVETPTGYYIDNPNYLGPYQIGYEYWLDSKAPGRWEDVNSNPYSEKVMINYWKRYTPKALKNLDFETLSRTHYGGPIGAKKISTESYWRLVQNELKKTCR